MNKSVIFYICSDGDIFKSNYQALVCPVNCYGIMGKGLALKFKHKFPEMHFEYKNACTRKRLKIGEMFLFINNDGESPEYIFCFHTKIHWRTKSKLKYIRSGLRALKYDIIDLKLSSIAIPALGCGLGGLDFDEVLKTIQDELSDLRNINMYIFAPKEKDNKWKKKNY